MRGFSCQAPKVGCRKNYEYERAGGNQGGAGDGWGAGSRWGVPDSTSLYKPSDNLNKMKLIILEIMKSTSKYCLESSQSWWNDHFRKIVARRTPHFSTVHTDRRIPLDFAIAWAEFSNLYLN